MKEEIKEDGVPANAVGGGGIDGIGYGDKGEPGVSKKKMKNILMAFIRRRKKVKG